MKAEPVQIETIRLTTSYWSDKRGLHVKRSLIPLRRKSSGLQLLKEDAGMIGTADTVLRIVNLNECKDGVYRVTLCNEHRDYETGCIEDYDYRLVPVTESPETALVSSASASDAGTASGS